LNKLSINTNTINPNKV